MQGRRRPRSIRIDTPACPEEVVIAPTRLRAVAAAAALILTVAACGGEDDSPTAAGPPSAEVGATLLAVVGTEEEPEAVEIVLTTEAGEEVSTLAAGAHTIEVTDHATIHNVALTGPGVEERTSVTEAEEATWEITVEAGEYDYVCDPHPNMAGSFVVTG